MFAQAHVLMAEHPSRYELSALEVDLAEWAARHFVDWDEVSSEPPCPATLERLVSVVPADLEPRDMVPVLRGLERASAWLAALAMQWAAAVADAADLAVASGATTHVNHPDQLDAGEAEVAAALALSSGSASRRVALSRAMCGPLAPARDVMLRGDLTYVHALVLADATAELAPELATEVARRVSEKARRRSPAQFGRIVRREAARLDPIGPEVRAAAATGQRRVTLMPLDDGMAALTAFLPATTARAIHDTLTAAARAVQQHDPRVTELLERLRETQPADVPDGPRAPGSGKLLAEGELDERLDTLRADLLSALLLGLPGAPARQGATTTPHAARADASLPVDAATAIWDTLCQGPIVPPVEVQVVVDLATLLGLRDEPCHLRGYGPLPPGIARGLAASSSWRRLVSDPLTGQLLDRSPKRYRVGHDLMGFVHANGDHCRFTGCLRPGSQCDIDHAEPFNHTNPQAGGESVRANLGPLCRRHHRLKTLAGWRVRHHPDGSSTWTSVLGVEYVVPADEVLVASPPR